MESETATLAGWVVNLAFLLAGALVTLASSVLLERHREKVARANRLRDAYAKWLALLNGAVVDFEELFTLAERAPQYDIAFLQRLEDRINAFRPSVSVIFEISFTIGTLDLDTTRRTMVSRVTKQFFNIFTLTRSRATAHEMVKHQDGLLAALRASISAATEDERRHPRFEANQQELASIQRHQQEQFLPAVRDLQMTSAKALAEFKALLDQLSGVAREVD